VLFQQDDAISAEQHDPETACTRELQYQWVSECYANAGRELERNLLECELGTPFVFQTIEHNHDLHNEREVQLSQRTRRRRDDSLSENSVADHPREAMDNSSHCLTFANGAFRTPFHPSQLYMDPQGRLCQNFTMRPWSRYGTMKGVLSDVLCNKMQWRIISDDEEATREGANYFLQWEGKEYPVVLKSDDWEERVWKIRQTLHDKKNQEKS